MRLRSGLVLAMVMVFFFCTDSRADEEAIRIVRSARIISEVSAGGALPADVLKEARAVAVFPDLIKLAFIAGGSHGNGVLVRRTDDGGWSDPVFISMAGASIGLQAGAQSMDVVLLFRNDDTVERLYTGKFTIGADIAVVAGPVGKRGETKTDLGFKGDIYAYSRTRGVFAGVSLVGAAITVFDEANERFYGRKGIKAPEIFSGKGIKESGAADDLKEALGR